MDMSTRRVQTLHCILHPVSNANAAAYCMQMLWGLAYASMSLSVLLMAEH